MKVERLFRIFGWAGVAVGLTGVIPGLLLLRGSMIEFGLLLVLLGSFLLVHLQSLEELRHIRRGLARLALRERSAEASPEARQEEGEQVVQ